MVVRRLYSVYVGLMFVLKKVNEWILSDLPTKISPCIIFDVKLL